MQCAARAVSKDGDEGLELSSLPVTISREQGLCAPRMEGSVGAEPFTAKMKYTGEEDLIGIVLKGGNSMLYTDPSAEIIIYKTKL